MIDGTTGQHLGDVHPREDSAPKLSHDTSRTIKRSLGGVIFDVAESALVDPVRHRLRVQMLIGGSSLPLGTFVFADATRARTSRGRTVNGALLDLGFILDQARTVGFGVWPGENIGTAIARLADEFGFTREIEPTAAVAGAPMAWAAGTTSGKIMDELAVAGGYLAPWFDHSNVLQVILAFDPALAPAEFDFDADRRIKADSIAETNDLLSAPNRFVAIDNSVTTNPIVGIYDVPSSAPHSEFNRGFVIAKTENIQGLADKFQADAAARARGLAETLYERVTFTTPPDPRHESWDVIRYDGHNWIELAWSMDLHEGGSMQHTARRTYM